LGVLIEFGFEVGYFFEGGFEEPFEFGDAGFEFGDSFILFGDSSVFGIHSDMILFYNA
jgi:hypothetical protein